MEKVKGSRGNTQYTAENDTCLMVKLTRVTQFGETSHFYVPKKMLLEYALQELAPKVVSKLLAEALRES